MSRATPLTHAFNDLPDVDAVTPLSDADLACLRDVREVLERHRRLQRFGVVLLHKHFELEADEILLETTSVRDRVQTIRPVKAGDLAGDSELLETSWSLQAGEVLMGCRTACVKQQGEHTYEHVKTSGKTVPPA